MNTLFHRPLSATQRAFNVYCFSIGLFYLIFYILFSLTLYKLCFCYIIVHVLIIIFIATEFSPDRSIVIRAALLGELFALGSVFIILRIQRLLPISNDFDVWPAAVYMCVLSVFHFSEYACIAHIRPENANSGSFCLWQSNEFIIAMVASWLEFIVELILFPGWKSVKLLVIFGLTLVVIGEALRISAMLTAARSFSHTLELRRREDHTLVTTGVYSLCRHPSYAGWFLWAIGTQVMLANPVCAVGFAIAAQRFFSDRVATEERSLLFMFGAEYESYQRRVRHTGVPFVRGCESARM